MKLSISLSSEDVATLDRYARAEGLASRSAAIQRAIRRLGDSALEDAYAAAWDEWVATGDAADWETTSSDGLTDAAR
jgi:Arc/MetJ-type ribon-helix-helix transcriptional regulator